MSERLNVIALISGGKDSFYSLLHCIEQGHRVIALANLFPDDPDNQQPPRVHFVDPNSPPGDVTPRERDDDATSTDLNSFMYQTVGHEIIHLYAAATGIPLYRLPVRGGAVHQERDYDFDVSTPGEGIPSEEAESMYPLLQHIKARHPEANAVSAGAILSSYQRTRVESVALRLGLVPLAYLWKYPILPSLVEPPNETQLLEDMATAGLEARIVKVASAGLDDDHLWQQITSRAGAERVKRALRRFGAGNGAALGEGGEFETVVLDGPESLFKKRIAVSEDNQTVIREGGGSSWLKLRHPYLEEKLERNPGCVAPRTPSLFDSQFQAILETLEDSQIKPDNLLTTRISNTTELIPDTAQVLDGTSGLHHLMFRAKSPNNPAQIGEETARIVAEARQALSTQGLDPGNVTNTVVILRHMSDFPLVNAEYTKLFPRANPPSRVTISCGDLLPSGCNVLVYMTAPSSHFNKGDRQGLHVQSRSYWAPANIGPYSQAIDVPITSTEGGIGLRSVTIAGQIPLLPATMKLPTPSESALGTQVVLALQHLWRIGKEMSVHFWTSAVAYFPRCRSSDEMQQNARFAGYAWKIAHGSPDEEDAAEDGPDPWDLKYNPAFMTLANEAASTGSKPLPDWTVITSSQREASDWALPPLFAVEVEELPRQSMVEWHAHYGLGNLEAGSAEMISQSGEDLSGWEVRHFVVRTEDIFVLHSVLWKDFDNIEVLGTLADLAEKSNSAHQKSIMRLGITGQVKPTSPSLAYIDFDRAQVVRSAINGGQEETLPFPVIPCRSIWSSFGERCVIVALYRTTLRS